MLSIKPIPSTIIGSADVVSFKKSEACNTILEDGN
jgi:hypothetical protein